MDDLVQDFLNETTEGLTALDNDLLQLEKTPDDQELLGNIFRVMHTIKGTCGFLGLNRLASVAHAGENILDKMRDAELVVTEDVISLVLECIDCIKGIISHMEENGAEPEGDDSDLIARLNACAEGGAAPAAPAPAAEAPAAPAAPSEMMAKDEAPAEDSDDLQALFDATESLVDTSAPAEAPQEEGGAPAEDSDDLQALFDATESLVDMASVAPEAEVVAEQAAAVEAPKQEAKPAPVAPAAPAPKVEEKKAEETKADTKKTGQKSSSGQSIRVSLEVLENLMQQASELVLTRNQLLQLIRTKEDNDFSGPLQRLNYITTELQEGVMKTRMQPISTAWAPLPRIIRDLAHDLGKKIELRMEGEETELDRQLLEYIKDPLTHMVRNSADHGLETPEGRKEAGKSETGIVNLKAYHEGGFIILRISDDGKGLNAEAIRAKVIDKGLASADEVTNLSDKQVFQFIFKPGFSTAEQVTSVSGRGVGMDVVRTNIESIGGAIELDSELGKGTTFTIKIPLTLAIMSVLIVEASQQRFAIPQISIMEVVKTTSDNPNGLHIEMLDEKPILRLRGQLLPLVYLSDTLHLQTEEERDKKPHFVVVCEVAGSSYGIIVDRVCDTEEIVVKPVAPVLKAIDVYSGITILGDGRCILILDPNGMARAVGEMLFNSKRSALDSKGENDAKDLAHFVMFKSGDKTPKVVPLELVSRLEEIDVGAIEYSKGKPVIQYRGQLMYLTSIDPAYQFPQSGIQEVLVFASDDHIMGLAVESIMDIVRAELSQDLVREVHGFMGTVVIEGKTCDIVDAEYYFAQMFGGTVPKLHSYDEGHAATHHGETPLILFVDDSPFFRKFIPPEFERAGFEVVTAKDGMEAFEILEENRDVSILVTDINMPKMSGTELAKKCRLDERFVSLPIVALSSHTEKEITMRERIEGIDAYISKTSHSELIEGVTSVLKEKEKELQS